MAYSAFVISTESRSLLLSLFPPSFDRVVCHHITVLFGIPENSDLPNAQKISVVGYAKDDFAEVLCVAVDGNSIRPDGRHYHITHSLDSSSGKKPVYSNEVISDPVNVKTIDPIEISFKPSIIK